MLYLLPENCKRQQQQENNQREAALDQERMSTSLGQLAL